MCKKKKKKKKKKKIGKEYYRRSPIDGLVGIADDNKVPPVGEPPHNIVLDAVCVLETGGDGKFTRIGI